MKGSPLLGALAAGLLASVSGIAVGGVTPSARWPGLADSSHASALIERQNPRLVKWKPRAGSSSHATGAGRTWGQAAGDPVADPNLYGANGNVLDIAR